MLYSRPAHSIAVGGCLFACGSTLKDKEHAQFSASPLVCWTGYGIGPRIKGNPGPCWTQEPGLARRVTAPRTVASGGLTFDPGPSPVGRGQLLSGVRRQKQDQSHSDKQSEYQTLHGLPSFWLAPRQAQACNEKRQPCKFKLAHALRTVHWRRGDMAAVSPQFIAETHLPTRLAPSISNPVRPFPDFQSRSL